MSDSDNSGLQVDQSSQDATSNPLGLAGFIVSLVGLCSGGTLSIIGLVLSIIAVFRKPRGFAIAGIVLGALGILWIAFLILALGVGVVLAVVLGLVEDRGALETAVNGWQIKDAIVQYQEDNGVWPTDIGELISLESDRLEDRWGRAYHVTIDSQSRIFQIVSDGPDGEAGTDDDIEMDFDF